MTDSLVELLDDHPFADAEPLLFGADGQVLTAGEARRAVDALALELRAAGVEPGQGVAVQLPNDPGFIVAMFAVWRAGAVFVPVNARMPETERAVALDATRPAVLLTATGIDRLADPRTYESGVAFVLWTSGTTGHPKPILHTHRAYVDLLLRVLGPLRGGGKAPDPAKRPTPNLIPVSLALNAGIYNVLFGLLAGAPIVVMDGFSAPVFAHVVAQHQIRSTVLPPALITMLSDDASVPDLAPLRFVRSITAPLSPLQARRFTAKFGAVVLNGYGQAEIGEVIGWTAADAREHPDRIGAVGRAHPGVEVRIANPDEHGVGKLLVKVPAMAAGYAAGGELSDRVDADGFLDTGDLARLDDAGFVWIEGRTSDLINRGGNKVFPDHVEEVLRLVPGVVDVAVVGAPDERLGEVPVAFVVLAPGADVSDDTLVATCREHLVAYKVPVAFQRVESLPRSPVGKVLRRELAAQFATDTSP